LAEGQGDAAGQSSTENGYFSGGGVFTASVDIIQKFPFAVDAGATDIAELTQAREQTAGTQSGGNA